MKQEKTKKRGRPPKEKPATPKSKKKKDPARTPDVSRRSDGTFAPGHAQLGGIQRGQRHALSMRVQNSIMSVVADEMDTDRFRQGLADLYTIDPKGYFQVLAQLSKFAAPALTSQSIEMTTTETRTAIDDILDQMMNKTVNNE